MENHAVNGTHEQTDMKTGTRTGFAAGRGLIAACALALAAGLPASALAQDKSDADAAAQPVSPADAKAAKEAAAKAEALKAEAAKIEAYNAAARAAQGGQGGDGAAGRARGAAQPGGTADPTGAAGGRSAPRQPGLTVEGAGTGAAGGTGAQQPGPGEVTLSAYSDAVELKTLVEYVAETLQINIAASDTLTGSVVLNAPVTVKRENLIHLLNSLLEQQGFMITRDETGFYKVLPQNGAPFNIAGQDLATTKVIATPGIRPSSLAESINSQLGVQGQQGRLSFMDDLGVIVITDSPRRIEALSALIDRVLERAVEQQFLRFDLEHVAASVMRLRIIELLGGPSAGGMPVQPGQPAVLQTGAAGVGPSNSLGDRLTVDASGNALIFRGFANEAEKVSNLVAVLDRPNTLNYEQYYAGSGALQIAQLAERLGLGHVEQVDTLSGSTGTGTQQVNFVAPGQGGRGNQILQQNLAGTNTIGGPVMVVDAARSTIIYYGTGSQQAQLKSLIAKFDTEQELVTIRAYKILNQPADVVADVIQGMVTGQPMSGGSSLLPGQGGGFFNQVRNQFGGNTTNTGTTTRNNRNTRNQNNQNNNRFGGNQGGFFFNTPFNQAGRAAGQEGIDPLGGDNVFVMADTANNQVLVKAPGRQQEEFSKLINKLDQRRPQVFIDVQIVSVSSTDEFRLAFENQLINANGSGGAVNTNFGLGELDPGFLSPKTVNPGLAGMTAAIILSDQVPLVINALKRDADTRILSSPQILVDDNEEAEIVSVDQQPTTTTTQTTGNPSQTSFGGYEEAGTRLLVTPSISEGGYMRLLYEVELSNFVGVGSNGVPPPKQVRNVKSNSVTIPSDTTIVVGGIKVDAKSNTVVKVPLLGDIPLIGHLFRDTNRNDATTRLYIFITPRIMRDPNFADLRLLTRGPRIEADIPADTPPLEPIMIEMHDSYVSKAALPMPGRREEPGLAEGQER